MRKLLSLVTLGLVALVLAIGAVACDDDDDDGDGNGEDTPLATEDGVETPEDGGDGSTVNVDLLEFQVVPDVTSAPAGSITFNASNIGGDVHELVIIRTDLDPSALPPAEDGSVDEAGEGIEVIDEIEEFDPGGEESLTVPLEAGSYALICNVVEEEEDGTVEAHYAEGMFVGFEVTE